jgi:hypothetical protein
MGFLFLYRALYTAPYLSLSYSLKVVKIWRDQIFFIFYVMESSELIKF